MITMSANEMIVWSESARELTILCVIGAITKTWPEKYFFNGKVWKFSTQSTLPIKSNNYGGCATYELTKP